MPDVVVQRRELNILVNGATGTGTSASRTFRQAPFDNRTDSGTLAVHAIPTGTFSTLTFNLEVSSDDGSSWSTVQSWNAKNNPYFAFLTDDVRLFRFNCTGFAGGTSVVVNGVTSGISSSMMESGGLSETVDQGAPNAVIANAWPVEVTDGTNVLGTPTHPIRTDPTGTTAQPITGSITASGTVTAKLQDGSGNAITSDARGSARPLAVEILDASGGQITSFGSGTVSSEVTKWGGGTLATAANSATDGTGIDAIIRTIPRRYQAFATTATLAGGASYAPTPWIDTQQTGDVWVEATCRADQASAAAGFLLEESDNSADANFTVNITTSASANAGTGASVSANTTTSIIGVIKKRYWRVRYVNGASAQGSFSLYATASNCMQFGVVPYSSSSSGYGAPYVAITTINASTGSLTVDGASNSWSAIGNVSSYGGLFNGATWDRVRTPSVFKTGTATAAGNTAVWTPTAGKKFRLMRYQIEVQEGSTLGAGANDVIKFQDATTDIGFIHDVFIPAAALATMGVLYQSGWIDLGNGILSAAANNVLNINIGTVLTAGGVRVNVAGCEE